MKVRHSALVLLCGLAAVVLFDGGSYSTVFAGEDASYKLAYDLKPGTVYVLNKKFHAGTEGASPRGQVQSETSGEWNVYLIPVELPGGGKKVIVRSERARIGVDKYVVGGRDMTLQAKLSASMRFAKYPRSGMEIFSADEAGAYFRDKMFRDMPLYTATASMAALSLPAKEMKVGDTWEEKRDLAKGFATYKFRFDGIEEKSGEKCMAISATYILTGSDGRTAGGEGSKLGVKVWVSLEGHPVAAEGVSEIILGPQSKTTETFTLTLKEKKNIADDKAALEGYKTIAQMLTELGTLDAGKNPGSLKSACEYRDKLAKEFANHPWADKSEEQFKAGLLEEIKAMQYAVMERNFASYGKERSENLSVVAQKYISDEKISARSLNALTALSIAGGYEGFPGNGLECFSATKEGFARADLALLAGRQKKLSDEAKQTLLLASVDSDATTRQVAARYLARLADEDSAKLLISLLGDKTESVKENALESLKAISGKDFGFDAGKWEEWLKGGPKMTPAGVPGYETEKLSNLVSQYLRAEEKERPGLLKKIKKESKSSYKAVQEALVENPAFSPAPVGSLGMLEVQAEGRGKGAEYALYVPHDYRPDRSYPVMIALAGGQGQGDEDFAAEIQRHTGAGYIVIAPSSRSPQPSLWWDEGKFYVIAALKEVISRYNVDTDRVFIGGHSNGGIGSWHIACLWPDLFAGVCPNAGHAGRAANKDNAILKNLINVPFLVQHGETDRVIPARTSGHFVDLMKDLDCDVEYIVYPKLGHAFTRRPDGLNEQFYKIARFADAKRRKTFPKHVYFKSPHEECRRAYWIELVRSGGNPTVEAEVTKDNVIDIKARDVSNITLYLGDELLDLDKKVTINLNGEKALEKKFKRSIETLLDTAIAAGDRKLATPVKVEIAVK